MGPDSGLWGAVVALIGLIGAIYTGRRGPAPKELPPAAAVELVEASGGQLQVSPAIWRDMQGKIGKLEEKVDHLTELVEQSQGRETRLRDLLQTAMRIVRRANTRLTATGQPEEPVPHELTPYG
ncbi:hypothetical protein [Streptomyces sp. NPDC020298]|uniref:hypothetical protein n=1 Tax=unclassified Streptomyces TaxID=2593676 RepID=UPI0033D61931